MTNIILGILGSHGRVTQDIITHSIIIPSFEEFGKPYSIFLSSEGVATIYIENYVEKTSPHINIFSVPLNLRSHGSAARRIRDVSIINECTHFIIFLGKKSKYYENLAEKLAQSGKQVITVTYVDYELTRLECDNIVEKKNKCGKNKEKYCRFIED